MSVDPLEQRLTDLTVATPDPGRVSGWVLSRPHRSSRGRVLRLPAAGLAAIVLFAAVMYFAPVTAAVLASVPIGGDLLREAGLAGAAGKVTSVGARSASSGFAVTLVGAYADSDRTVLLLEASPAITAPGNATLVDQFGRSYPMQSGIADARTGDLILQFDPLAWPDTILGARMTLRFDQVQSFYYDPALGDWAIGASVSGSWSLPASLGVDEATTLGSPPAGRVGGIDCTFSNVRASSATIVLDIEMRGVTPSDLDRRIADGGKGKPVFELALVDPGGNIVTSSWSFNTDPGGTVVHLVGFRDLAGPYKLRVVYLGDVLERTLQVP